MEPPDHGAALLALGGRGYFVFSRSDDTMDIIGKLKSSIAYPFDRVMKLYADARGYSVIARHYFSPILDARDFPPGFWDQQSELVNIELNEQRGLELVTEQLPPYLDEFRRFFPTEEPADGVGFWVVNGVYMAVDAHLYYAFVRHFKPRRIVEIGSGQSTLLAVRAAAENLARDAVRTEITAIEPYPDRNLSEVLGKVTLVEKPLQAVDLALFEGLTSGDILFIDSTHVLREGNDVQLAYLEILPRLAPGVIVHVHDISLPRRYPKTYFDQKLYWNEQYLLQAFLTFNSRFEILWAGNHRMFKYPQLMHEQFPEIAAMRAKFPSAEPASFWMRVKQAPT